MLFELTIQASGEVRDADGNLIPGTGELVVAHDADEAQRMIFEEERLRDELSDHSKRLREQREAEERRA